MLTTLQIVLLVILVLTAVVTLVKGMILFFKGYFHDDLKVQFRGILINALALLILALTLPIVR